jgi:hypothetical protein
MKTRIALLLLFGLVISFLSPESAQAGTGMRAFCGWTEVKNGNFVNAPPSESGGMLYGLGTWGGRSEMEFGISWYGFEVEGNVPGAKTVIGSSNQFLLNVTIRPLKLGEYNNNYIRGGLGIGVGETFATLDGQEFRGFLVQPEISVCCPLYISDDGEWRDHMFYPNIITAIDIRIGMRKSTIGNDWNGAGNTKLDWSGFCFSVGLSVFFNSSK